MGKENLGFSQWEFVDILLLTVSCLPRLEQFPRHLILLSASIFANSGGFHYLPVSESIGFTPTLNTSMS